MRRDEGCFHRVAAESGAGGWIGRGTRRANPQRMSGNRAAIQARMESELARNERDYPGSQGNERHTAIA
jgi:hypothetical protein